MELTHMPRELERLPQVAELVLDRDVLGALTLALVDVLEHELRADTQEGHVAPPDAYEVARLLSRLRFSRIAPLPPIEVGEVRLQGAGEGRRRRGCVDRIGSDSLEFVGLRDRRGFRSALGAETLDLSGGAEDSAPDDRPSPVESLVPESRLHPSSPVLSM
ncbi:MAG TPA: hypothetical protein VGI39_01265 [Polyangiaceae bacterium]